MNSFPINTYLFLLTTTFISFICLDYIFLKGLMFWTLSFNVKMFEKAERMIKYLYRM